MIKHFNLYFILLCTLFSMVACSHNNSSDELSNNTPLKQEQTNTSNENTSVLPHEYASILNNLINAYPWNDDDITMVPENPELSYMYRHHSTLSEIGFAVIDLDNNGQTELILTGLNSPFIYDLYTISNGETIHLFDSGERYGFYLYENGYIENQWSSSAATSGFDFFKLNGGTLELIERITLDAYHALDSGLIDDLSNASEENSFFRSDSELPEDYKPISSEEALQAIEDYHNANKRLQIEYTLLAEYKAE